MKKVAVLQSNYIPWKGYFDLIASVDEFIIYDDVQYTRRDWRNRNKIKTPQGLKWLTVPVQVKGKYDQKIKDTLIDGTKWSDTHLNLLKQNYSKAPHFLDVMSRLEPVYAQTHSSISKLNHALILIICNYLGISTEITFSSDYDLIGDKTERLAHLCLQAGGNEYVSGPSAKDYIEKKVFDDNNLTLTWFDYAGYPEHPQLWGEFSHGVSILDLMFNCGEMSREYMKYITQ